MKRTVMVYFSPTHGTQKVLRKIADGLQNESMIEIDLTTNEPLKVDLNQDDCMVFGVPVYGGRMPVPALERLERIKGTGQLAVCVSVYGNISYGNALKELVDVVKTNGFSPVAGATFIAEHSFSNDKRKIAKGRPNSSDLNKAYHFGEQIKEKQSSINNDLAAYLVNVPGNVPNKKASGLPKMGSKPLDNCTLCLKCARACPVGAIDDKAICDKEKCIKCCACVKACPEDARQLKNPLLSIATYALSKVKDKEPELFL